MANSNRRPGVDADIFQGTWLRGYDVPAGDQTVPPPGPAPLVVSSGKSHIDQSVSELIFASRTDDINHPIFVLAQGPDATAPSATVNFHIGNDADPNGVLAGMGPGSLYASYGTPGLWQLQADGTTWEQISDDLGGEDLAETLAIGNFTGGHNIVLTNGDSLKGEDDDTGADGGPAIIQGGRALGATGDGGGVLIVGGTSLNGATGGVTLQSPAVSTSASSGSLTFITGNSLFGGNSGGMSFTAGDAGAAGVEGDGGNFVFRAGHSLTTGLFARGGNVSLSAGFSQPSGRGGRVIISAGNATGATSPLIVADSPGRGGDLYLRAGRSASSTVGANVLLIGGAGGPAGAAGGNVVLTPGEGGGGFPAGIVNATGIFQAENIKRGSGNPNGVVAGSEGSVYQRTDTAIGEIYLNTNGSINGWKKLAFAGDLVEAFEQLNWGYFSRATRDLGGGPEDAWSDLGLFKGLRSNSTALHDPTLSGNLHNGPYVSFSPPNDGNRSAIDASTGSGSLPHQRQQRFILTFRARNAVTSSNGRIFLGVSTLGADAQLASTLPGGGSYLGFLLDGGIGSTWRVITSNGLGVTGPLDTGVLDTSVSTLAVAWHFVIDTTESGVVRFFILDPNYALQSSVEVATTLPTTSTTMGLVMGSRRITGAAPNPTLQVVHACLVNDAHRSGQGGGVDAGSLALNQVLLNGNTTGPTDILMNHAVAIRGVEDDNAGNGASFTILSGATTFPGNNTGIVAVGSANASGGGAENPGATTGQIAVSSGHQLEASSEGNTGQVIFQSGQSLGISGETGDITLRTGDFEHGGLGTRTQGTVRISAGSMTPGTATITGDVLIKGGSSSMSGVTGGAVLIQSGENNSALGNTGAVTVETFPANVDGSTGILTLRSGNAGSNSGSSGEVRITTGEAAGAGDTGPVQVATGQAHNGSAGSVNVVVGNTTVGDGSHVTLRAGPTTDGAATGGSIILEPGTGPAGDGEVRVEGKLTVTGLIDPTGLVLDGQGSVPTTVDAGQGLLWVDNTGSPSRLIFTNDLGTDHDISEGGGGGATTLAALSDVNLAGLAVGEVLTFNGAEWTNLPGVGGSPLATILGLGNETGGTAGGIVVSHSQGDRIASDGDLILDPAVAPGNAVMIDGLRWPENDGAAGYVLTTNGSGILTFQPGGGAPGAGESFAEAFAQMQYGNAIVAGGVAGPPANVVLGGMFGSVTVVSPGTSYVSGGTEGPHLEIPTSAVTNGDAGIEITNSHVERQARFLSVLHFDCPAPSELRFFAGVTSNSILTHIAFINPGGAYAGVRLITDAAETTFHLVSDDGSGSPDLENTGVSPNDSDGFWLTVDTTDTGVRLSLYNEDKDLLAQHTFVSKIPSPTIGLNHVVALRTLEDSVKTARFWSIASVTRADLLNAVASGGSQNLNSVLSFGNETGGIPIKGSDGPVDGGPLVLEGGSAVGGGGSGGDITLTGGSASGIGAGGSIHLTATAGSNDGDGGTLNLHAGDGGSGGGFAGGVLIEAGDATGGDQDGGRLILRTGAGFGTANGGNFQFLAGNGGAGGGDGGGYSFTVGSGAGGGVAGIFAVTGESTFDGDMTVTGKLTVTGLIDPPGLLMTSSSSVPFTPSGSEGGIWINNSGELVFTNAMGDLNLSTAIGGGPGFADALLVSGYGFLSAADTQPQSYGIYGGSATQEQTASTVTFGSDNEGPFLNLAVPNANGEAFVATGERLVRRDQRFRAKFKFQVQSAEHTDERLFIGLTNDDSSIPTVQLGNDDPVGVEFVGIRQTLGGSNLEFVSRGSGGASTPVLAIPTDTAVHYLEVNASIAGEITLTVYAQDGFTVETSHTIDGFLIPSNTTALRPFIGIHTEFGPAPTRSLDFYFSSVITRADVIDAVVSGGSGSGGTPTLENVLLSGNSTEGNAITAGDSDGNGNTLTLQGGNSLSGDGDGGSVVLQGGAGDGSGDGGSIVLDPGDNAFVVTDGGFQFVSQDSDYVIAEQNDVLFYAKESGVFVATESGEFTLSSAPSDSAFKSFTLAAADATDTNGDGGILTLKGGEPNGDGLGGSVELSAGLAQAGDGGSITLTAGDSVTGAGGSLVLKPGEGTTQGVIDIGGVITMGSVDASGISPDPGDVLLWSDNGVLRTSGTFSPATDGDTDFGSDDARLRTIYSESFVGNYRDVGGETLGADFYGTASTGTITLPSADVRGRVYILENTGSTDITLLPSGGDTVNDSGSSTITQQYVKLAISDGTSNWRALTISGDAPDAGTVTNNTLRWDDTSKRWVENANITATAAGALSVDSLTAASLAYPTSDGTNGQVLTTDGAGNLTFSSISGTLTDGTTTNSTLHWDGNDWVENTNFLATDAGNITAVGTLTANGLTYPSDASGSINEVLTKTAAGTISFQSIDDLAGDYVKGPASATNNALVRFDGTTGKLVKNSNATLSDAGALALSSTLTASNIFTTDGANFGDASGLVRTNYRAGATSVIDWFQVYKGGTADTDRKWIGIVDSTNHHIRWSRRDASGNGVDWPLHLDWDNGNVVMENDLVLNGNGAGGNGSLTMEGTLTASGLTYPTSDGTNGQVLTTNGAGTLTFSSVSGTITDGTTTNSTLRWDGGSWVENTGVLAESTYLQLPTGASALRFGSGTTDTIGLSGGDLFFTINSGFRLSLTGDDLGGTLGSGAGGVVASADIVPNGNNARYVGTDTRRFLGITTNGFVGGFREITVTAGITYNINRDDHWVHVDLSWLNTNDGTITLQLPAANVAGEEKCIFFHGVTETGSNKVVKFKGDGTDEMTSGQNSTANEVNRQMGGAPLDDGSNRRTGLFIFRSDGNGKWDASGPMPILTAAIIPQ